MDISNKIKQLIKEADLYRTQSLLSEARDKYRKAVELVKSSDEMPNKEKIIAAIHKKIEAVSEHLETMKKAPTLPETSKKVQDLIMNLFTFSNEADKDKAVLEGAIALAKFGQTDRALKEFRNLLRVEALRLVAAKNIIRCHLSTDAVNDAVAEFREWQGSGVFNPSQLEKSRSFLQNLLDKKGVGIDLAAGAKPVAPAPGKPLTGAIAPEPEEEEEILDISSVAITLDHGPHKGEPIELDVSFQAGNIISMIISSKDKDLIDSLQVGTRLTDVHFYSPIAIFSGSAIVAEKSKIKAGPKAGDYSLDIRIESV